MKNKNILIILFVLVMFTLSGCNPKEKESTSIFEKITADEAKEMMDQNADIIILDVRTKEEYNTGYIQGAILIPYDEIADTAEGTLEDKSATILLYCRSGRRSEIAAQALSDLGYTNIYDFGGILDWNYDVVTD